jgi:hypothetical protein
MPVGSQPIPFDGGLKPMRAHISRRSSRRVLKRGEQFMAKSLSEEPGHQQAVTTGSHALRHFPKG